MSMSPHFGPHDRNDRFPAFDLNTPALVSNDGRLKPREEAEARFLAHIALAGLPHDAMNVPLARKRYDYFVKSLFEGDPSRADDIDCEIIAACLTPHRDVFLVTVRDRTTGNYLLPHPDDIRTAIDRHEPERIFLRARRFDERSLCGVLFDRASSPESDESVIYSTPVLLPHLMRREALRFQNGDPDSLIGELFTRLAREELAAKKGKEIQFVRALVDDDSRNGGFTVILSDRNGSQYAARLTNTGGALLHEVEFFTPLVKLGERDSTPRREPLHLKSAFRRYHARFDYTRVPNDELPVDAAQAIKDLLTDRLAAIWKPDWEIKIHQTARAPKDAHHFHVFVSIADADDRSIIPAPDGASVLVDDKLGGLLIHIDETPKTGLVAKLRSKLGLPEQMTFGAETEALIISPESMALEIRKLVSSPGQGLFEKNIRSVIERDIADRGLPPVKEITFTRCAPRSSEIGLEPLPLVLAKHAHGQHLVVIAYDDRTGLINPNSDFAVEAFFSA